MTDPERPHVDRAGDKGWLCWAAARAGDFWNFIDKRDIDKHVTAAAIIVFFVIETTKLTEWGLDYANVWLGTAAASPTHAVAVPGSEVALVLAAVLGPWSLMVSTVVSLVVSFYFKARST